MKHCWHHKSHMIDVLAGFEHLSHCCFCNRICMPTLGRKPDHGKFLVEDFVYVVPAEIDAEECPSRETQGGE